uniref:Proprotein convertase subtilisin/kexin type 4 n=1 Tax=Magallana gigas TaxID=29159 RepID=K1QCZ6_MAGGI
MLSKLIFLILAVITFANITEKISANEYAVKAESKQHVMNFSSHTGCRFVQQVTSDYFLIRCPSPRLRSKSGASKGNDTMKDMANKFKDTIKKIEVQKLHKNYPRTSDSNWTEMWNLNGQVMPSMKVKEAWSMGHSGSGVTVAVVDNGFQLDHPDLRINIDSANSYDYYNYDPNPSPTSVNDSHGTMVTGLLAAEANNSQCIVGVAHQSTVIGIKLIGDMGVTDVTEALSLKHNLPNVDIYTNSWGPSEGFEYAGPGSVTENAFYDGVTKGRGGKGSIYVWAAGNGGLRDNCNADGYVNNIYTIPITSVDADGKAADYAEVCAPVFAATYSGNERKTLTSTSLSSSCVTGLRGTSFSTPLAAGMIALALQTNPSLTCRDVQHLVVETSKRHDLQDDFSSWQRNGAGFYVSQVLGFGLMDAEALVTRAKTWVSVPQQNSCSTPEIYVAQPTNFHSSEVWSMNMIPTAENCLVDSLEHVKVNISFSYSRRRGNVILLLESPAGTKSYLMTQRPMDSIKYSGPGSVNWYFSSVHFWGEQINGTWKLTAKTGDKFFTKGKRKLYFYTKVSQT